MKYLYPNQIIYLHKQIISATGGSHGVREKGLLESAVYGPQASFGGQDFYPDVYAKAAVLCHSIINKHPFIDGNKKTGFESMRLMLRFNGYDIKASPKEKFDFVTNITKGKMDIQSMAEWIRQHSLKIA